MYKCSLISACEPLTGVPLQPENRAQLPPKEKIQATVLGLARLIVEVFLCITSSLRWLFSGEALLKMLIPHIWNWP